MPRILAQVAAGEYTIEEVDAITGPAIGRPKSATFRTLDLAGIDILGHVIENLHERLPDDEARARSCCPPFVEQMLERGLTGEKSRAGILQAREGARTASREILTLDPATLEYRPQQAPKLPVARARPSRSPTRRARHARCSTATTGSASSFARRWRRRSSTPPASRRTIAHSPDDVDRVMRWGFGWELRAVRADRRDRRSTRCSKPRASRSPSCSADGMPPLLARALDERSQPAARRRGAARGAGLQILRAAKDRSRS